MSCQLIKKNGEYRKMAFNLLNKREDNLLINLQIRMLNVLKISKAVYWHVLKLIYI
jgi:hypothetical protein